MPCTNYPSPPRQSDLANKKKRMQKNQKMGKTKTGKEDSFRANKLPLIQRHYSWHGNRLHKYTIRKYGIAITISDWETRCARS